MTSSSGVKPSVILVINTSPDIVELLTLYLERFEFLVVSCYTHDVRAGRTDLERLLREHRPSALVYDLAPPYLRNWKLFQHLRSGVLAEIPLVLTSTNARLVSTMIGLDAEIFEVVETPEGLGRILAAVRGAVGSQ